MQFKKIIPYKLKRLVPMLGLAGATLFTACEKDEPIHDVEIIFYEDADVSYEVLQKHIDNPSVRHIYMIPPDNDRFMGFAEGNISASREWFFEPRMELSPKMRAKGNFRFKSGIPSKIPEDSLWFVKQGWTINKHLQNQK